MTFRYKKNRVLVGVIIASFLVMIGIGFPLLNNALKGKEKDFYDKLFFTVARLEELLIKDPALLRQISGDSALVSQLQTTIKTKIDSVFLSNGIPLNYVLAAGKLPLEKASLDDFGKIQKNLNNYQFFWSSNPMYNSDLMATRVRVALVGHSLHKIYLIKIFFPFKRQYLLGLLMPEILTMALALVILFTCFLLLLSIVRKQIQLAVSKNDFISNMTHELKTPLFTMSIAVKMLEHANTKPDEKQRAYIATLREEIARLLRLADQVLETSRTDKRITSEIKEAVNVHLLLQNAVYRLHLLKLENKTTVDLNLDATMVEVSGNRENLENVFVNIIDNAIKYSSPGGRITIQTKNDKQSIIISVADNGIGFDPELKELVFERFFRAHTGNIHNVKGYGIGLSFARSVIEAHDGRIQVNTSPGEGSEFILTLPVLK